MPHYPFENALYVGNEMYVETIIRFYIIDRL